MFYRSSKMTSDTVIFTKCTFLLIFAGFWVNIEGQVIVMTFWEEDMTS